MELSRRYILLYEKITGQRFQVPDLDVDPKQRMAEAVEESLERL